MESIRVSFIRSEITKSLSIEQEKRNYRKSLEQLLANASKTTANENNLSDKEKTTTQKPTAKSNNQPTRSKQIGDALISIMCYGGDWRVGDMRKRAGEVLGFEVAKSTLRYVLKRDERFSMVSDGFYCLTQKGLEEAKQHCTANDEDDIQ